MTTEKSPDTAPSTFNNCNVLYDDKFCTIRDNGQLELKWYYFPFAQSKLINIEDIKELWYQHQEFYLGKYKGWGMGLTKCWWACDIKRDFGASAETDKRNIVLQVNDSCLYKGFSCQRYQEFLLHLKKFAKELPVHEESMPFWNGGEQEASAN